jgi:hypothetical protein
MTMSTKDKIAKICKNKSLSQYALAMYDLEQSYRMDNDPAMARLAHPAMIVAGAILVAADVIVQALGETPTEDDDDSSK